MLFGYDRGHGLLAASRGVSKTLASKILPDTDWDPRVSAQTDGYLSARPVPGEKAYVVMKTWRAPEMPRPGCVWTHVLLIADADLSRIPDLRALGPQLQRPKRTASFDAYTTDITFSVPSKTSLVEQTEERVVRNLVELVYKGKFDPNTAEDETSIQNALLAIWSQQWPALRRGFSFRTALLSRSKQSRKTGFEIELRGDRSADANGARVLTPDLLELIVHDVMSGSTSQFRRFLWRYGADTGAERKNLLFLSRIYQTLYQTEANGADVARLVAEIGELFPEQSAAQLLKTDLTQPSDSEYSILPAIDPLDVVIGVRSSRRVEAFPHLGTLDEKSVNGWISNRPEDLTKLLISAADDHGTFAEGLYNSVSRSKNVDFIWTLFDLSEHAFIRALGPSIDVLDVDRIEDVSDNILLAVLERTKSGSKKPLKKLVPRLLLRNNTDLIAVVHSAVPETVIKCVVRQLASSIEDDQLDRCVDPNWVECVRDNPDEVIEFAETQAETRSQLLACRYLLNADSRRVPLTVWSTRLVNTTNDLYGYLDTEFRVFLLVQALRQPSETAPTVFQDAFDHVYDALAGDRLNFRTEMELSDQLPHIGWLNNWDKCLRLKIATVACYKHLGLSKKQLRKVTSNSELEYELAELWSRT